MKRLFLGLVVSALVLGSIVERAISIPSFTEDSRLRTNGIGFIEVGMTVSEAERASGRSFFKERERGSSRDGSCTYVSMSGLSGVSFMLINGKIARVDVDNPRILTLRGAKIGDSEDRIKKLYPGQIKTTPNPYRGGHYLTFYPKDRQDRDYRLIFVTGKEGRVGSFRGGKIPEVEYIEGCS
jgi:hypothetical protein